jgi:Ser/Thr protein kinase RdoA (MazF antagonist)
LHCICDNLAAHGTPQVRELLEHNARLHLQYTPTQHRRYTDPIAEAHARGMPSDRILLWAAAAVGGTCVVSTENLSRGDHRPSGTFRLRIERPAARATEVILKVPVPRWIAAAWVITNARALQLAETHGLAAPRLIAADLDGSASGTVTTLETFLSGSADLPPTASVARLREAGAALAGVHAFRLVPQAHLPYRPRPCAVDDRAAERWRGLMPTTPLLQQADERVRSHGTPTAASVFVHGDVWGGNMLWEGDRCVALIDWKTAGVGNPGVDLGCLRMQMALQYGQDAPSHVLEGWERQAGLEAIDVPYWDAVAALNTPTLMHGWLPDFADGSPLDATTVTERRDAFLRGALGQLPTRIS